jgi:hypothetical protein
MHPQNTLFFVRRVRGKECEMPDSYSVFILFTTSTASSVVPLQHSRPAQNTPLA